MPPIDVSSNAEAYRDSLVSRFEGLGDNCEFGFVLRKLGFESGGLFRWTVTRFEPLIRLLESDFENLYEFENLVASPAKGMVRDSVTGVGFHTKMKVSNGEFEEDYDARRLIHQVEKTKIDYLVTKMRVSLTNAHSIFVRKSEPRTSEDEVRRLFAELRRHSACSLLHVFVTADRSRWGRIDQPDNGLLLGWIDRFAPASKASEVSLEIWLKLMAEADRLIPA